MVAEIAAHHEVRPNQVTAWKTQALEHMAAICGGALGRRRHKEQIRQLREKNGGADDGEGVFVTSAREISRPERQAMIDGGGELSMKRQAGCYCSTRIFVLVSVCRILSTIKYRTSPM
jgi:transposase-like protein